MQLLDEEFVKYASLILRFSIKVVGSSAAMENSIKMKNAMTGIPWMGMAVQAHALPKLTTFVRDFQVFVPIAQTQSSTPKTKLVMTETGFHRMVAPIFVK